MGNSLYKLELKKKFIFRVKQVVKMVGFGVKLIWNS